MKHQPYYQIQFYTFGFHRWVIDDVNDVINTMSADQLLPRWLTFIGVNP